VAIMVAVPTAMVVVGLAVYQNNKKAKPVKLPGLIVSVVFSWYDFMSDVWFALTPASDPQWAIFPVLGLVVVVLSTAIGAGVVVWVLSTHSVSRERWGVVDRVTAVLAATNLELLPLLPWEETGYEGLPSKTVATVPTVTLFAEDLPQLFIQGLYLVLSRDIGNYVVIASVALSGCSLLLRFAKAAMHMLRRSGHAESKLAETSPMLEWDGKQLREWAETAMGAVLEDLPDKDSTLVRHICEEIAPDSLVPLLSLFDRTNNFHAAAEEEAAEAAEAGGSQVHPSSDVSASESSTEQVDTDVSDVDSDVERSRQEARARRSEAREARRREARQKRENKFDEDAAQEVATNVAWGIL